jgi:hypothetical protein
MKLKNDQNKLATEVKFIEKGKRGLESGKRKFLKQQHNVGGSGDRYRYQSRFNYRQQKFPLVSQSISLPEARRLIAFVF